MSQDSKPTKTAAVSKRKPRKKGTVSKDSKPMKTATISNDSKLAEESAGANDTKPTKTATVSEDSKPLKTATVSNDRKPRETGVAGETPVFDFTKLMSQFQLPGVNFTALVDRERKNIEALVKANRIAFEGWQRLVRRQAEMLQETMKKVVADAGQEDAKKKRADLAKEGFEKALANMRELAEITTQSQKEAFDVVRKRIEENVEGIRTFGKKAGK
jgi:phasin family protein